MRNRCKLTRFTIRRLFALVAPLVLTIGCVVTSGSEPSRALGLGHGQADWVTRVLGRPPDMVDVFKPFPGMDVDDIRSGHTKAENTATGFAYVHCRQVDTYFYGNVELGLSEERDDYGNGLVVFHGVPAWLDPARPIRGEPELVFVGRSGSGVRAYRERTPSKQKIQVFVLPSSAWIIAGGPIGDRVARVLASDGSEPAPLDSIPGSWVERTRRVDADKRRDLANLGWQPELPDLERLVAIGMIAYPAPKGQRMVLGAKLVFSDSSAASNAAAEAARDPRLRTKDFVGVERFGTTVVLKLLESR